jgi:hypothetical protein
MNTEIKNEIVTVEVEELEAKVAPDSTADFIH